MCPFDGVLSSPNFINVNGFIGPAFGLIIEVYNASDKVIIFIPDALLWSSFRGRYGFGLHKACLTCIIGEVIFSFHISG